MIFRITYETRLPAGHWESQELITHRRSPAQDEDILDLYRRVKRLTVTKPKRFRNLRVQWTVDWRTLSEKDFYAALSQDSTLDILMDLLTSDKKTE